VDVYILNAFYKITTTTYNKQKKRHLQYYNTKHFKAACKKSDYKE